MAAGKEGEEEGRGEGEEQGHRGFTDLLVLRIQSQASHRHWQNSRALPCALLEDGTSALRTVTHHTVQLTAPQLPHLSLSPQKEI